MDKTTFFAVRKREPCIKCTVFYFSGGEGIIYVEATKPGKVTLIGLYLETKCIEDLTISVIYKDESGLEEDNFLVSVNDVTFLRLIRYTFPKKKFPVEG